MCSHLRKPLAALEEQHKAWLAVARLCTDDEQTWALEVSFARLSRLCSDTRGEANQLSCGGSCCAMTLTTCRALCS